MHLRPAEEDELVRFAETFQIEIGHERDTWLASKMISLLPHKLDTIQPQNTKFEISAALNSKIEEQLVNLFLNPAVPAYLGQLNENLMACKKMLKKSSLNLLPKQVRELKPMKVIESKIGSRFTHHRNEAKAILCKSVGKFNKNMKASEGPFIDIVVLTRAFVTGVARAILKDDQQKYKVQVADDVVEHLDSLALVPLPHED
ncbi:hypothetical protein GGU10DRAFT_337695 [Lentinula aff. detonsa]|uniref:Uncharacterized protein n=1 Tax=Lentinula aff. detonsa TaxID=2804958 RepID=A0AA38NIJ1_9AGAR|nr:hypothetical protein GGU10DRAFT_337695 [Lentinula aff. detonsa]